MIKFDNAPSRNGIVMRSGRLEVVVALVTPTNGSIGGACLLDGRQRPRSHRNCTWIGPPSFDETPDCENRQRKIEGSKQYFRGKGIGNEKENYHSRGVNVNSKTTGHTEKTTGI